MLYIILAVYVIVCMWLQAYINQDDNMLTVSLLMLISPITIPLLILVYIWLYISNSVQSRKRRVL